MLIKYMITPEIMKIIFISIYTKYMYYGPFVNGPVFPNFMPFFLKPKHLNVSIIYLPALLFPYTLLFNFTPQSRHLNAIYTVHSPLSDMNFQFILTYVSPNPLTFP